MRYCVIVLLILILPVTLWSQNSQSLEAKLDSLESVIGQLETSLQEQDKELRGALTDLKESRLESVKLKEELKEASEETKKLQNLLEERDKYYQKYVQSLLDQIEWATQRVISLEKKIRNLKAGILVSGGVNVAQLAYNVIISVSHFSSR